MTDQFDPSRIYQALVEAGNKWADTESAASLLEESRRSILAELANQSGLPSVSASEQKALADPVYKLHITNMVNARRDANRARVAYDAQKILGELRRTEQSNLRAEMGLKQAQDERKPRFQAFSVKSSVLG